MTLAVCGVLGAQIFKSIQISADTPLTQHVLGTYTLKRFHSIQSNFDDETEEFPSVHAGLVTYLGIIQSSRIGDGGHIYQAFLEQFFDIFESYLRIEIGPLAPAILPLMFSGYPIRTVRSIIYHFDGDKTIPYLQYTVTQLLMQPSHIFRLGRISVFDKLDLNDLQAIQYYGAPPSMTEAVEAILLYIFPKDNAPKDLFLRTPHRTWAERQKPGKRMAVGSPVFASAFHRKCVRHKLDATLFPKKCGPTRRRYLGLLSTRVAIDPDHDTLYFLLLNALLWLIPKAGYSDSILAYMRRLVPRTAYQRYPKLARQLRRCFDAYIAGAHDTKMRVLAQQMANKLTIL